MSEPDAPKQNRILRFAKSVARAIGEYLLGLVVVWVILSITLYFMAGLGIIESAAFAALIMLVIMVIGGMTS